MVGAGLLLCISGFGNTIDVGNYNFMSHYCHEIVQGISLSILMFTLLGAVSSHWRKVKLFGAGACFGAVLFTKPEVVLAAAAGLGVMLAARIWSSLHTQCRISALKEVGMVVIGAALTVVLASVAFHRGVPELPLYYAIAAPWLAVMNPAMTSNPFYHAGAGLDMPAANVVAMLRETFRVLLWLSALLVLGRVLAVSRHRRWVPLVCSVAGAALLLCIPLIDIYTIGRALPLLGVAAIFVLLCKWQRERVDLGVGDRSLALIGFALFGLILLIKMGLASRLHHDGVFLGMPTLVVCGSLAVGVLPECLPGSGGEQCYRRAVMGLAIALFARPWL